MYYNINLLQFKRKTTFAGRSGEVTSDHNKTSSWKWEEACQGCQKPPTSNIDRNAHYTKTIQSKGSDSTKKRLIFLMVDCYGA